MKIGDLVRRKGTKMLAIVTTVSEWFVGFVWLDDGERDACSKQLMEVINENR